MRPYLRLYVFAVLLFVLLIGAVRLAVDRVAERAATPLAPRPLALEGRELTRRYESAVSALLAEFGRGEADEASAARAAAVVRLRDELLAFTVPAAYKDFHLDLIIALSRLEKGYGGDGASLEAGRLMLREVTARYPWASL